MTDIKSMNMEELKELMTGLGETAQEKICSVYLTEM